MRKPKGKPRSMTRRQLIEKLQAWEEFYPDVEVCIEMYDKKGGTQFYSITCICPENELTPEGVLLIHLKPDRTKTNYAAKVIERLNESYADYLASIWQKDDPKP